MMVYNQLFLYRYDYVIAKEKRTKTVTMFLTYFQQHSLPKLFSFIILNNTVDNNGSFQLP